MMDEQDEVIEALNQLIEMGLVEIVGINPQGEWLYGLTQKGKDIADRPDLSAIFDSMIIPDEE